MIWPLLKFHDHWCEFNRLRARADHDQ
jgi:hypothetical protein